MSIDKTTVVKDHSSNGSCSNCMSGTMIIENGGISQTVNKSIDSVVMVKNYQKNTLAGSGSGFVYKTDDNHGYIMTNYHVIDKAEEVKILFNISNAHFILTNKFIFTYNVIRKKYPLNADCIMVADWSYNSLSSIFNPFILK